MAAYFSQWLRPRGIRTVNLSLFSFVRVCAEAKGREKSPTQSSYVSYAMVPLVWMDHWSTVRSRCPLLVQSPVYLLIYHPNGWVAKDGCARDFSLEERRPVPSHDDASLQMTEMLHASSA